MVINLVLSGKCGRIGHKDLSDFNKGQIIMTRWLSISRKAISKPQTDGVGHLMICVANKGVGFYKNKHSVIKANQSELKTNFWT